MMPDYFFAPVVAGGTLLSGAGAQPISVPQQNTTKQHKSKIFRLIADASR
jgi:hypothetical protein